MNKPRAIVRVTLDQLRAALKLPADWEILYAAGNIATIADDAIELVVAGDVLAGVHEPLSLVDVRKRFA